MKKNNKNKLFKYIFYMFLLSYLIIYFSEITGYYEYQNHSKTTLTAEQIKKFENDVSRGKEIDINAYIDVNKKSYKNNLSKTASKVSDGISILVQKGVEQSFRFLSKILGE